MARALSDAEIGMEFVRLKQELHQARALTVVLIHGVYNVLLQNGQINSDQLLAHLKSVHDQPSDVVWDIDLKRALVTLIQVFAPTTPPARRRPLLRVIEGGLQEHKDPDQ